MISISDIFNFLKDRSLHISIRVATIIFIITLVLAFNDWVGLSRNYQINTKLEQIERLKTIDSSVIHTPSIQKKIAELSTQITNSEPYLYRLVTSIKAISVNNTQPNSPILIRADWYDISAMSLSYLCVILCLISAVGFAFTKQSWKQKGNGIIGALAVAILLFVMGKIYKFFIALSIPIFSDIRINYTLNVLIQLFLLIFVIYKARKSTSKELGSN